MTTLTTKLLVAMLQDWLEKLENNQQAEVILEMKSTLKAAERSTA